jgi:hypothetical protein
MLLLPYAVICIKFNKFALYYNINVHMSRVSSRGTGVGGQEDINHGGHGGKIGSKEEGAVLVRNQARIL